MGKQGQHQFQGQDIEGVLKAADGLHKHELSHTRGVDEGRLPILVGESVR